MSKIINLRQARKRKARAENTITGDVKAARFGESKEDRTLRERQADKAARDLDGHERET